MSELLDRFDGRSLAHLIEDPEGEQATGDLLDRAERDSPGPAASTKAHHWNRFAGVSGGMNRR